VQDFPENLKIYVKLEVSSFTRASQSKHFVAISVALHGTVASFRLGDVKASHLSAEKNKS
jgi:hypothetical protein